MMNKVTHILHHADKKGSARRKVLDTTMAQGMACASSLS